MMGREASGLLRNGSTGSQGHPDSRKGTLGANRTKPTRRRPIDEAVADVGTVAA